MADLNSVVAKLKQMGYKNTPPTADVARLPGLSDQEKAIYAQAINTGQINMAWMGAPKSLPPAAVQKRDDIVRRNKIAEGEPLEQREKPKYEPGKAIEEPEWFTKLRQDTLNKMNPRDRSVATAALATPGSGVHLPSYGTSSYLPPMNPVVNNKTYQGQNVPGTYVNPNEVSNPQAVPTKPNPPGNPISDLFDKLTNPFDGFKDLLAEIKNKSMPAPAPEPTLSAPDIYTPGAAPALPDYSSIKIPESIDFEFKRNPFTKEGRAMAEEAYAPQYETIENLRGAANNQYKRSDKVVDQLYEGLADDLAASAATRQDEYEGAQARVREHASDSAADLGKGYASSMEAAKDVANQMMGYERGSTSPGTEQVITEAAAEQARQQAQSKQEGEKTAGSLARSAATQGDYSQKMGEAYQTQGAVSRENLIDQLNNTLGEYANQELNLNSEERQSALSLASMLSDRDWAAQQQNYQMLQDQYNQGWQQADWQRGLVDSGYNNQWNQYQAGEQGRQFGSQQEWDAYNKALEAKIAAEEAKAQAAADAAEAAAEGGGLLDPGDYGGTESVGAIPAMLRNYVTMRDPQNASQVTDAQIQQVLANASGVAGGMGATLLDDEGGMPIFVNMVLKGQPNLTGLQRDIQARAAEYYWNAMRAARISPAK